MSKSRSVSAEVSAFHMPYMASNVYNPGHQPNNPGQTPGFPNGLNFNLLPWPDTVPTINALSNNPGTPHARGIQIQNNQYASLPSNYLFVSGVVGKSLG